MNSENGIDVLATLDAEIAAETEGSFVFPRGRRLAKVRDAFAELIDASAYALRTRDDAGALSDTAEHNLRAALAAVGPTP